MYFSLKLCFVSKYDSELSHVPSPTRCILRSCVIRSHARPGLACQWDRVTGP